MSLTFPKKTIKHLFQWILFFSLVFKSSFLVGQISSKVEKSFDKIKISTTTKSYTVKNDYGKKWQLRITFPEGFNAVKKSPLFIGLHWAGTGNTFKDFHDCLAVPGTAQSNAILITPEGEGQAWDTQNNVNKIVTILSYAKLKWNIDSSKVVIFGYSNGGNGSWYHAEYNSQLFSAAIPIASYYLSKNKIDIPIYAIHGGKDELFPINKVESFINIAKQKGTNVHFKINKTLSHFEACNYIEELQKGVAWVTKSVWKQ